MFDSAPLGAFGPHRRNRFRFFPGSLATGAAGWQTWTIPRNATFVYLLCVGGGASGAGGQSSGASTLGGGGGGGGSGAKARLLIPASFLPKTLYLSPGAGGAGVAAATAGNPGVLSYVSDQPGATAVQDLILVSGTLPATGPVLPVGASSAAGAAETIATNTGQVYSGLGIWTAIAGQAGTAAGASAGAGVNGAWGAVGIFCSGGTGGGTTNTTTGQGSGGLIGEVAGGLVSGNLPGGVAGGGRGNNGQTFETLIGGTLGSIVDAGQLFATLGGTGGGAKASGTAGDGGSGGYGSGGGGGGGGGGTSGGTGGRGGAGGPGFILVSWW